MDTTSREAWSTEEGLGERKSQKTERMVREHHLLGMMQTLQAGTHTAVRIFPRPTRGQTSQQLIIHLGGTLWGGGNELGLLVESRRQGVTVFGCGPIGG